MKIKKVTALCFALCLLLCGCGAQEKTENEMYLYYLNAENSSLLQEVYPKMELDDAISKVTEMVCTPQNVEVVDCLLLQNCLQLYFSGTYADMNPTTEVLFRAAVVQTMTQIDGVNMVSFYVDGVPLTDVDGYLVGMMSGEDFVQNTGSSIDSYQTTDLTLYFANKEGVLLKESKKTDIRYNASTSIERLTVERLMKGTNATDSQPTIPKTTKLLSVSIKDDICYVNFDSKFLLDSYDLHPEVTIYSIVNSVIANGNVTKVQILIDGASDVAYMNVVDLSKPLEWNENLIGE